VNPSAIAQTLLNKLNRARVKGLPAYDPTELALTEKEFKPEVNEYRYGRYLYIPAVTRMTSPICTARGNTSLVLHAMPYATADNNVTAVLATSYCEAVAYMVILPTETLIYSIDFKGWAYIVQSCNGADTPSRSTESHTDDALSIMRSFSKLWRGATPQPVTEQKLSPVELMDWLPSHFKIAPSYQWEVRKPRYSRK